MKKYQSVFFGEIDFDKIEECYDVEFSYENREIELDLNIYEEALPSIEQLLQIDDFIKNVKKTEEAIRQFIEADFKNGGIAKEYIEHHAEELEAYDLEELTDKTKSISVEQQLLSKIYIQRIGFYPNDNSFAIFDFYIDHELSDQILVIVIDNEGNYGTTWES